MEPLTRVSDPWSSNDRHVSHGAARQLRWSPALVFQTRGAAMIGMSHMVQSCQLRADLHLVLHVAQGRATQGYCWGCALGFIRFVLYRRKRFLGVSSGADVRHGVLLQGLNIRHLVTPQSLLQCADLAFVFHSKNKDGEIKNVLLEIRVEGRRKVELWPVHV